MSEITPYPLKFNGRPYGLVRGEKFRLEYLSAHPEVDAKDIGFCAIALFRKQDYEDYVAIAEVDDVEGTTTWTPIYEQYDFIDWMAGFVYDNHNRAASLKHIQRELGHFAVKYGWSPDVVLEDRPSQSEHDNYITYVVNKDNVDGQLFVPEET